MCIRDSSDNAYDLGSSTLRWRNIYVAQYVRVANGYGIISDDGAKIVTGAGGDTWRVYPSGAGVDIFAVHLSDGSEVFKVGSDGNTYSRCLLPYSDNAYD